MKLDQAPKHFASKYAITLLSVSCFAGLQWVLWPVIAPAPFILFYPAIILAALHGEGISAIFLSAFVAQFLFVPPMFSLRMIWPNDVMRLMLFLISSFMIRQITVKVATALKEAQTEREKSKEAGLWLSTTLSSIGDAVIATDQEGRVSFMNRIAEGLTEWSFAEAKGRPLLEVFHIVNQHTREVADNPLAKVMEKGSIVGLANHTVIIGRNGKEAVIEDRAAPIRVSDNGPIIGVVLVFRDTSEKYVQDIKLTETHARLQQSEARLRSILENALDAVVGMDDQGLITHWNPQAEKIFGFTQSEAIDMRMSDAIIPPQHRMAHENGMKHYLASGEGPVLNRRIEITAIHRDGSEFPIELSITPIKMGEQKIFAGFIRDITDVRKSEIALRESETRYRTLVETLPQLVWTCLPNGQCDYLSRQWVAYTGIPEQDQLDLNWLDRVIHPEDRERTFKHWMEAFEGLHSYDIEFRIKRHDGEYRWFKTRGIPVRDQMGKIDYWFGTCTDIEDVKRTEQALKESETHYRQLANSIPQLAWMAKPDGFIFWYNAKWYEYSGTTPSKMEGWGWQSVHDPEMLPMVMEAWNHSIATGQPFEMEFPIKSAAGEFRWFLTRVNPIFDSKGNIAQWFGTNTDIHAQKEIERDLRYAKDEAENANQLKTSFLANMSHEMRTPLGVILGFTDLIIDPLTGEEERKQFASTIRRNGEQLSVLINDILDLSKVESGYLKVETFEFSLRAVVEEIVSELSVKANEKGLFLKTSIQRDIPATVSSDSTRLKQILLNLVGNAIKFTEKGGVTIKIARAGNVLHIEVEDSGIGIKNEEQDKLFRPFSQADESITRKYGGTGLGLALSKRLAELLGGNLVLKNSEPHYGSNFELTIKDYQKNEQRSQESNNIPHFNSTRDLSAANESLSGMRILLTEDSPDNQLLIFRILSKKGAEVDIANNGAEGVEKALRGNYDLVLMDLQMPVLDGYTATQRLRDQGYRKAIIALTAHAMNEVRERCLDVGFTDHLPKPINAKQLVDTLMKYWPPKDDGRWRV